MKTTWLRNTATVAVAAALTAGCGMMDRSKSASAPGPAGERITLSGASEVPPVSSAAAGTSTVTVSGDCSVTASASVTGMTATAAHIHVGAAGANGPVAVPLNKTADNAFSSAAGAKMNEQQCAAYRKGETYVNVHSAAHPNGEVRGQLRGR